MSLQYRKSAASGSQQSAVDWEQFEEVLARVDPRFSDPRFDSLKHVLTVLSSNNAEQEVDELREQRDAVEELVDSVVEGYHAGFNKAIHNYSQILRLFNESKMQLELLRRSLEAGRRRLSARSRHLVAQYQRDLMLTDTLRLLDDIQACLEVPARVARLEGSKEWPMAVSVLLDGCNKLAREELAGVGALAELAEEMSRRRDALQGALVVELEARIYRLDALRAAPPGSSARAPGPAEVGPVKGFDRPSGPAAVPRLVLPTLQRCGSNQEGEISAVAGNLSGRGLPPRLQPAAMLARANSWARDGSSTAAALAGSDQLASLPRRGTHRRALTLGGLGPSPSGLTAVDGHLVDPELPLSALVDCVAQLGGLHEAQQAIRRHMPRQLRLVISRAVDAFPAAQRLPLDTYMQAQRQKEQQPGYSGGEEISVPPAVAATARALVEHVLGCCMQVFQQVTALLLMFTSARVPKASSGLELLRRQQQQRLAHAAAVTHPPGTEMPGAAVAALPPVGPPSAETTRVEVAAAWNCLQTECQKLLADLLGVAAPAQQAHRGADAGDVPLAGWLASVTRELQIAGSAPTPAPIAPHQQAALVFSLDHELGGLLSRATEGEPDSQVAASMTAEEARDLRDRVQAILGGWPGNTALVAPLYRPVLAFAEAAERHVSSLTSSGSEASKGMAALLSMPWRSAAEQPALGRSPLRSYVESFLRMEFLPAVYVSTRARCSAALEDSDAFKPRTRLRAPYQPGSGAEGRPVLPAALATERMVEELVGWAGQVPPFATHLTGVLENVLGRVLEAFEAHLVALLGGSLAGRLAESLPVVQLMVKEPAAVLLGSPVAFFVGRNTEAMESFVSSVITAGFGANDEAVACDILQRLMAERPVPADALLSAGGDVARLATLAALCDSLDYIADVIQRCTSPASSGRARTAGTAATAGGGGAGDAPLPLRQPDRQSTDSSGGGGSSGAATPVISESWQQQQHVAHSGGSLSGPSHPGLSWQQQLLGGRLKGWRRGGGGEGGALTEGLSHLSDRYRALAGQVVRALRLDLLLLVVHHLQQLPRSSYVCQAQDEAREVDECVAALARLVGRLDEGLEPYLPPNKRAYVFASLASAAAHVVVWLLPDIHRLNHLGVQRMCRMLASLQPALSGVGGTGGTSASGGGYRPDSARQFDRAKLYYTLLTYSADGLIATVAERPHRFTAAEYLALLMVDVVERPVSAEHEAALQKVLTDAGRLAKPSSKANAVLQGALAKAVKAIKA